jgi:hypothetical protein
MLDCDWSSDVCSSDLERRPPPPPAQSGDVVWDAPAGPVEGFTISEDVALTGGARAGIKRPVRRKK